jgi:hypothetical protein
MTDIGGWEDILKASESAIQPDKDACCENAFESTKIWFEQNNFSIQNRRTKEEHGIEMFEDCDSLRYFLSGAKTFMDSPEGNELQQILEEWKRCESTSVGNWRRKLA